MSARENLMRLQLLALSAALALSACATTPTSGPSLRYADAASRGAWAALLAGSPSASQVERATEQWSEALSDSFACDVPMGDVINAGLVGALELGAMNAAASRGGESEVRAGVARYIGTLTALAVQRREPVPQQRCEGLRVWAPQIAEEGREAVARARRNGLMEDDYGLLLNLLR
jgi:hypothetical protein